MDARGEGHRPRRGHRDGLRCLLHRHQSDGTRRLFLHMGAYWLLHSVRLAAPKRSRWRGATFATIRSTFVKLACCVEELKIRIRLSFSAHLANARDITLVTARLCAQAP
jgi:Transposase DDE domain group 1